MFTWKGVLTSDGLLPDCQTMVVDLWRGVLPDCQTMVVDLWGGGGFWLTVRLWMSTYNGFLPDWTEVHRQFPDHSISIILMDYSSIPRKQIIKGQANNSVSYNRKWNWQRVHVMWILVIVCKRYTWFCLKWMHGCWYVFFAAPYSHSTQ